MKTSKRINNMTERVMRSGVNTVGLHEMKEVEREVVLLEDVVEVAKKIDFEWYIDYKECPKEVVELHNALAKLEKQL